MLQSTKYSLLVQIPVVLFNIIVFCAVSLGRPAGRLYYVRPANGSLAERQCPADGDCHDFSYYLQNASYFFSSNSIFHFESGIHDVNTTGHITIQSVRNLVLEGSSKLDTKEVHYGHSKTVNVIRPTSVLQCFRPSGLFL